MAIPTELSAPNTYSVATNTTTNLNTSARNQQISVVVQYREETTAGESAAVDGFLIFKQLAQQKEVSIPVPAKDEIKKKEQPQEPETQVSQELSGISVVDGDGCFRLTVKYPIQFNYVKMAVISGREYIRDIEKIHLISPTQVYSKQVQDVWVGEIVHDTAPYVAGEYTIHIFISGSHLFKNWAKNSGTPSNNNYVPLQNQNEHLQIPILTPTPYSATPVTRTLPPQATIKTTTTTYQPTPASNPSCIYLSQMPLHQFQQLFHQQLQQQHQQQQQLQQLYPQPYQQQQHQQHLQQQLWPKQQLQLPQQQQQLPQHQQQTETTTLTNQSSGGSVLK